MAPPPPPLPESAASERRELARLCAAGDWSKAIRILDSLLSHSSSIHDICNRAYCYSQLKLDKHAVRDCDRALQMDSDLLQAYILKGRALSSLGKKEDAVHMWEKGYEIALHRSADLKHLLELEELLASAKQRTASDSYASISEDSTSTITSASDMVPEGRCKSTDTSENHTELTECKSYAESTISEKHAESEAHAESTVSKNHTELTESETHAGLTISQNGANLTDTSYMSQKPNGLKINQLYNVSSKSKSIRLDMRLSRGIAKVNEGRYDQAVKIFDQVLRDNPTSHEALIGRGTAYAFQRELESAIADFSKAIQSNPSAGEAWKRRGQARAAMGEFVEAIGDLTKALEFEPKSSDVLHERGIVNFKFKDYSAAVEDLALCVKLNKDNKSAYTYLGLALAAIGECKRAEEAHLTSIELDPNFLEGWTHLTQFYQELANSEKAFSCLQKILAIDRRYSKAYHLSGLLHHGMGAHRTAIKDLTVGLSIESSNIECLYLRASCYHAIGEYGDAVKDYDAVLDVELDSMDKFVLQCLAFYQKEIALYTASKINGEFCWFDIDGDIDPLFKEYWCKKLHPKNVCEKVFRQPPLRESVRKGRIKKEDLTFTKQKISLLQAADVIGKKIQYDCPGFLPNRRQHRMAGLAVIEIAQKVSKAWRALQLDWKNSIKNGKKSQKKEKLSLPVRNRGGGGCSTSSSTEPSTSYSFSEDKLASKRFTLTWQEVYNLAVKWRQISEPCDPVVWNNRLSEEFNSGFGSHTPMLLGQNKVVRYFPNYHRALDVAKVVIDEKKCVYNVKDAIIDLSKSESLKDIRDAGSCSDLYSVVGKDFWLSTSCCSTACEGKRLEGTRITVQKMGEKGFDFAIRTPCTPSRWDDYDREMAMAWEALSTSYCREVYGSTDVKMLEHVRDAILRMTYYWYNFMPLSRGSAVVGYVVLLGLFLAANMDVTASIPRGVQVDWEAILSADPKTFIDSVKPWLYPSIKFVSSWKSYPDVASTFNTTGSVVAALSTYSD